MEIRCGLFLSFSPRPLFFRSLSSHTFLFLLSSPLLYHILVVLTLLFPSSFHCLLVTCTISLVSFQPAWRTPPFHLTVIQIWIFFWRQVLSIFQYIALPVVCLSISPAEAPP
ncbi:hypothetical protein BDV37DRAFT_154688 [Aspergillus pseudonomiae]|uniref:Uncharacterized protein n=1 Tax=Aspergillus pseudonomiae TaxID=1506151 RepID=A0A5N7DAA6_9EURO|nr:uncharacterized protein BDV37DRAFT_154688 [Aspergillus pseudonomiae]KAE8402678.1 hypothetical protein BDV37DRAFT_154688 [Aspergillus pseudonomiae]